MHHQKMIILGLVAIGKRYGFEIEAFISNTEMKRWAEIGTSTIYKVLKDLEKDHTLSGRKVSSEKGPAKTEYSLTPRGRKQLTDYILEALQSDKTARLDRISGLFFAPLLPKTTGATALEHTITQLQNVRSKLKDHLSSNSDDVVADAIIQFYVDLFEAEIRATKRIMQIFD